MRATPRAAPGRGPARAGPTAGTSSPAARRVAEPGRRGARGGGPGIQSVGTKLALGFWQAVADGVRLPRNKVALGSPLRALYRLYGAGGPLCALGLGPGEWPSEVTAGTFPRAGGSQAVTTGEIATAARVYPYTLFWRLEAGKPVLCEVMPAPHPAILARSGDSEHEARLRQGAPSPAIELDPVAAVLWRAELAQSGLPLAVRCLAVWWRLQERVEPAGPPAAIAAAIAGGVARAAGVRRTCAQAAATYATSPEAADRVTRALGGEMCIDRERGW